ncbi:imidazole glycerol phosphate synthase subunit HisF [Effusibacillus lacus]|uniref:Imidazole glycerol phosphate synthase subunit HisF n=1 Tax=Effusibacillus lacus TaxID=1348429 RepID=A0A292YPG2_9BACL|nr:imidazole glycerol phosphate synthase subunit HisF [Effusibacillus lacus]TCS74202.1 cyclase [Effusibacillus lacus]GAX90801.1 imidazole glycerol phosphate synthase cyclase subunit [Effusibacillus lacus]
MLTKRIIPCFDVKNGRVVKNVSFLTNERDAGDPVELAAYYEEAGADELVLLDITASVEGRSTMMDIVRRTTEQVFIPFTVGGGISSVEDIREILKAGADKVSINTAAVKNPQLIAEGAKRFGQQCIVVAIDGKFDPEKEDWEVLIHGGRTSAGINVIEWAKQAESLGAGEILLTSFDQDGQKDGYDLALTRRVSEAVSIPVIASGGAGRKEHFYDVFTEGKADAALAASIFHFKETSVGEVKSYLKDKGVPIR